MVFHTEDANNASCMLSDSPITPKLILADAEASSEVKKIQEKTQTLQAAMNGFLSGNMLKVYMLSERKIGVYLPFNNKDLMI